MGKWMKFGYDFHPYRATMLFDDGYSLR